MTKDRSVSGVEETSLGTECLVKERLKSDCESAYNRASRPVL